MKLSHRSWKDLMFGVPQGSISGPFLFNIFLSSLFFRMNRTDFTSCTDDTTSHRTANVIDEVIQSLRKRYW